MLDAAEKPPDNGGVKLPVPTLLLSAALLPLLATGCGPDSAHPQQQTALHEQNTVLRDEIARMEALIRQAGEDVPDLADQIARREQEVKAAVDELCRLTDQEGRMKKRALELQGRLDAFQYTFSQMQKDLTQAAK